MYNLFDEHKKITLPNDSKDNIQATLHKMLYNFNRCSHYSIVKSKLNLLEFFLTLLELKDAQNLVFDTPTINSMEARVSDIIQYINENYSTKLTLDDLAGKFFINKYYLCHIFKEITGLSVIEFINRKRLAESERLLKYSKHSIMDISGMVGFNNVNHYINLFKKIYSLTPKQFREHIGL